ncbi:hypothetical protein [Lysobacter sp. Root96]|uniref:hypothetical protein n=1 Tax=Lysobacter sp. Root96 TaxID=1736612 RepID=UPI0006FE6160|nr:hypothetical protein [Lysobacter sp. Root96]KRD71395.1 hypothetical protein ASE45_06185 [Lysobacter sp. Root96]
MNAELHALAEELFEVAEKTQDGGRMADVLNSMAIRDWAERIEAALAQAGEGVATINPPEINSKLIPPGMVLVPREPTPEMLENVDEEVGGSCYSCTKWRASDDDCRRVYAAMLAAAPAAQGAKCATCDGHGLIGGRGGQTPETYEEWAEPCPDCTPAAAPAVVVDDLYYMQDSRSYVGNCPLWWNPQGHGYTTRLDEAAKYTREEAARMHKARPTDIPWPCALVDSLRRPTCDIQDLGSIRDQATQFAAALKQGVGV